MLIRLILVLVASHSSFFHLTHAQNWCDTSFSCDNGTGQVQNTMCAYQLTRNVGTCTKMSEGIADGQFLIGPVGGMVKYWTAIHNTFRDQVAAGMVNGWPPASNMKQLLWDPTLMNQAQRWNFQCNRSPDPCNRNSEFNANQIMQVSAFYEDPEDGDSISIEWNGDFYLMFMRIANESLTLPDPSYLVQHGFSAQNETARLLASMLFANAEKLGGSMVVYIAVDAPRIRQAQRTLTYLAPGSVVNNSIYQVGNSCSSCPPNWKCNPESNYKHLCAKDGYPTDGDYILGLPGHASWTGNSITLTWLLVAFACDGPQ